MEGITEDAIRSLCSLCFRSLHSVVQLNGIEHRRVWPEAHSYEHSSHG